MFSVISLKEKLGKIKILSLAFGIVGLLFAIGFLPNLATSEINYSGVLLMSVASLCWALYTIIGKNIFKKYNPFTVLFYNFLFVLVCTLFLQNPSVTISQINASTLPNLLYLGIVTTFIAYILYYAGLNKLKSTTTSIITYFKPIISVTLAFLILNQVTNVYQSIGLILILISSILIFKDKE